MSQIYNKMRIDVKAEITDIITAKQDDSNSRFLDVYLYDGATPIDLTGEEVRIYMRKPDGTEIFNNGEITDAVNGRCQFELTSQALGAVGVLKCEISIWRDNTEILTTQTFHVFVTESLRSDGSVESSNEYGALVVLFQNLYQSIDLMQDMVANFGVPSGIVDVDTFWQMLEKLYEVNEAALANASVRGVLDLIGATSDTGGSATAGTLMAKMNAALGLTEKINDFHNDWYNANYRADEYLQASSTPALTKTIVNSEIVVTSERYSLGYITLPKNWSHIKITATLCNGPSSYAEVVYSWYAGTSSDESVFSPRLQTTSTNYVNIVSTLSRSSLSNNYFNNYNMYFKLWGYSSSNSPKIKYLQVEVYTYELVVTEEKYKIGTIKQTVIPASASSCTITFSNLPPIDRIYGLVVTGTSSNNSGSDLLKIIDYNSNKYVLQIYNQQPVRILY